MASKSHARIVWETLYWENFFWLQDVGSNNGTYLNGHRLSEQRVASAEKEYDIRPDDEIIIGDTKIRVHATLPPHLQHTTTQQQQQQQQQQEEGKEVIVVEDGEGEGGGDNGVISSGFQPNLYHPLFKPLREFQEEKAREDKKRQLMAEKRSLYFALTQDEKDHKRKISQSYLDRTQARQQQQHEQKKRKVEMTSAPPPLQEGVTARVEERVVVNTGERGSNGNQKLQVRDSENKGLKMLRSMGWKEGEGLGRLSDGMKDPLPQESNDGRAGLGFSPLTPAGGRNTRGVSASAGGGGRGARRSSGEDRWEKTRSRYEAILAKEEEKKEVIIIE